MFDKIKNYYYIYILIKKYKQTKNNYEKGISNSFNRSIGIL